MNFIFLTYVNRSGSTYLANLLDSSPRILACPEGEMLVSVFLENPNGKFKFDEQVNSRLTKIFSTDPKLQSWGEGKSFFHGLEIAKNNLEAFFTILVNYKNQIKPEADFILFKAERIVYLIKKIQKVDIKHSIRFISIIRDPRAVFASQKKTFFPGTSKIMSNNPVKTANYWEKHTGISYSFKDENFRIIRFEDLIMNYSAELHVLSIFFKQDLSKLSSENGGLLERIPDIQKEIHKNIQEKSLNQKIDEWQKELSQTDIFMIEKISGKYLSNAGYITLEPEKPGISVYFYIIHQLLVLNLKQICHKITFHLSRLLKTKY